MTCKDQIVNRLEQLVEADGEHILDCAVPFQSDRLVFFLYCNMQSHAMEQSRSLVGRQLGWSLSISTVGMSTSLRAVVHWNV
jgi:hypothetical protein